MSDEAPSERKSKKGTATMATELLDAERARAERREEQDRIDDVESRAALERAWIGRAEAAERSSALYFRLTIAMLGIVSMLVAGTVAVGAGIEIPGIGSFSVNKDAKPERASPGAESFNEQAEEPFAAPEVKE